MSRVVGTLCAIILWCCELPLIAQTTVWTGAVDHQFTNPANWTAGVPTSGDVALIPAATPYAIWEVSAHTIADFALQVADSLWIKASDAQLTLQAPWHINGFLQADVTGVGLISVQDSFVNEGAVHVVAPWVLNISTYLLNAGQWYQKADLQNSGQWVNTGQMWATEGILQNGSVWHNEGALWLYTDWHNLGSAILTNTGTWHIGAGGSLTNYAIVEQLGQLDNYGLVIHSGEPLAFGPNSQTTNWGQWTNQKVMSNQGQWRNAPCATFIAEPGSSALLAGAGTFVNEGILFVIPPNSIVELTQQLGFTSPNLAWGPVPTALCVPDFTLPLGPDHMAVLMPDDVDAGSSADYCGIASRVLSQTTFTCADTGPQPVQLTLTDSLGNSASCTTIVTIIDTIPPQIICPPDTTFELLPGQCGLNYVFELTATDNCGVPSVIQTDQTGLASDSFFPVGQHVLQFEANDGFQSVSCSFVVTVVEHQSASEVMVCNDLIHLSLGSSCNQELSADMILEGDDYGCYEDYLVEVEALNTNVLSAEHIGQSFIVTVTDPDSGNSCWGQVLVEDKHPPSISGCDTVWLYCVQNASPISAGGEAPQPDFTDCSGVASVQFFDYTTHFNCDTAFAKIIHRQWWVKDNNGYVDTCTQVLLIKPIALSNVQITCPDDVFVTCDLNATTPNYDPSVTGYPQVIVDGQAYPVRPGEALCALMASYEDVVFPLCGPGVKILRTWKVYDWCAPIGTSDNPWTCTQLIQYMDTNPPLLSLPDTLTVGTQSWSCTASPLLPPADISDCSEVSVSIWTPVGIVEGNGGALPAPGLPIGIHEVYYHATDACDNATVDTLRVWVQDDDAPVAICESFTVVSLNDEGIGQLFATSIDDGSTDNCCIDHFKIRRMGDACGLPANAFFAPSITFCCHDVGTPQTVVMRVSDCFGNYNECMVTVEVQDKLPPQISCPPDITLACDEDFLDLSLTGQVTTLGVSLSAQDGLAIDNCGNLQLTFSDSTQIDCGEGLIVRTWTASDAQGNTASCLQYITLQNSQPYDGSAIIWPEDIAISGCDASADPAITGVPTVPPSTACQQIMVGSNDVVVGTSADACLKILRTWIVVDWCQYDPNDTNSAGIWTHTQVIKIVDDTPPVLSGCTDRTFCNFKNDCTDIGVDLTVDVSDACTPDSLIELTWIVDLHADGQEEIGPDYSGTGQNFTTPYPIGTHRITYTATDGCGHATSCTFIFTIEDCKKPSLSCHSGLAVTLMADGQVGLPASVLIVDASDNCSAPEQLYFSWSNNTLDTLRTFTCDQLGAQPVTVWVTDEAGNQDYCTTTVIVQDNAAVCGAPLIAIGGTIADEAGHVLEGVQVDLSGNAFLSQTTDTAGQYLFAEMMAGHDYTLTPWLNADPLNGVTTFDIVLLMRHIQDVQPLSSPYKRIAADVDRSGHISVSDMLELRKLILHTLPAFTQNSSWRFVPADYAFPQPDNPWAEPFPEVISWNDLDTDQLAAHFVAIKVGDLDGSAWTYNSYAPPVAQRTYGTLTLSVNGMDGSKGTFLPKGSTRTLALTLPNVSQCVALQFTLEWDVASMKLVDFQPGDIASYAHFGLEWLDRGWLTSSWNASQPLQSARPATLAYLTFEAKEDVVLPQALSLTNRLTPRQAWNVQGQAQDIALSWPNDQLRAVLHWGSVPNPFDRFSRIFLVLPQKTHTRLSILDLNGRLLWERQGVWEAGRYEWPIDAATLPSAGVYLLRLETDQLVSLRKLVRTH